MGKKLKIYDIEQRIASELRRVEKDPKLTNKNKRLIEDYQRYCFSRGLSNSRVYFHIVRIRKIGELLGKDFDKVTKKDLEDVILSLERSEYADTSKNDFKRVLKMFYRWLKQTEEDPLLTKWIKIRGVRRHKLPEELLTVEDVKKLIDNADNPRDKALIAILYESGCRIGEIATLKIKDISFDKYGAVLIVNGKTGMRRVRLITAVHYLSSWLENHQDKENPEAPLWTNRGRYCKKGFMNYANIRMMIKRVAKKAGVQKRVNPHTFRHSRATHLANKLTEAQMKEYFGWVQDSEMAAVYVHLSGRDVDKALLQLHGIVTEDNNENTVICPRCSKKNTTMDRFCRYCGMPLNMKVAVDLEEEREKFDSKLSTLMSVLEDREVRMFLAKRMSKIAQEESLIRTP